LNGVRTNVNGCGSRDVHHDRNLVRSVCIHHHDLCRVSDVDKEFIPLSIKDRPARSSGDRNGMHHFPLLYIYQGQRERTRNIRAPDIGGLQQSDLRVKGESIRADADRDFHDVLLIARREDTGRVLAAV